MADIKRIITRAELVELARELKMRPDWHEPDEQEVTAKVRGGSFDNAGSWGEGDFLAWTGMYGARPRLEESLELWVILYQDGQPVAEVNLATLFAWATGFEG
jgi:hypothetical protein